MSVLVSVQAAFITGDSVRHGRACLSRRVKLQLARASLQLLPNTPDQHLCFTHAFLICMKLWLVTTDELDEIHDDYVSSSLMTNRSTLR